MLGLRFFACLRCDTVYAAPEEPQWCDSCGHGALKELTRRMQTDEYFVPSTDRPR